jgi:hypothetical protein
VGGGEEEVGGVSSIDIVQIPMQSKSKAAPDLKKEGIAWGSLLLAL